MGYNGPRRKHPDEETNPPPWNDTPTLPKGFVATSEKKVIKLPKEMLNPWTYQRPPVSDINK